MNEASQSSVRVGKPGSLGVNIEVDQADTKPRRRKVEHLYWVRHIEWSCKTGRPIFSLCGGKKSVHEVPSTNVVEVIGNLMPLPEPRDCKRCLRVLEARHRRADERRRRWEQM